MPLASGEMFAGFQILRPLGFGGMGEVYLVAHPRLPRQDALKILPAGMSADNEFRARFNREAELAATLYNPHIVGIHDRGEFDGQLWISMDFIDGPDAGRLLREYYPTGMPPRDVAEIVAAIADALDYAHARGLLHRDIKPPNILLTNPERGRRRVLLADFGIARNAAEVNGLTDTNVTLGTVNYASPEQLTGAPLDGRADQYSLAATAYHLLTGSPVFVASNPAVVIGRHLNVPAPGLAESHPALAGLDPVLAKALSKNARDRFPTCSDFASALREAESMAPGAPWAPGVPADPIPSGSSPPGSQTAILPVDRPTDIVDDLATAAAGSSRWPWALAALALVMIIAATVFAVWPDRERSASGSVTMSSRPLTTVQSTSVTPTSGASASASTPTVRPSPPVSFEEMRALVAGFYAQLPGNAQAAWNRLDSHYQQRNGLDGYLGFWSTIESVSVLSVVPRDATSVVATVRYMLRDGGSDTEDRWLSVVPANGGLLIYDSERIGPA